MFAENNNSNTMASALASLTANYTDSEGEEDLKGDNSDQETGDRLHPSLALTIPVYQTAPTGRTWLWVHQARGASSCQSGVCHLDRDQSLTVDSWSFVCSSRCTAALVVFVVSMLELFIKTIKKT